MTAVAAPTTPDLLRIPLDRLRPHPANRQHFDKQAMTDLVESLRAEGQLTPAKVRQRGDLYEILAGERRWRAAKMAGLPALRCEVVEPCDDARALRILLRENRDKEAPHPLDELRIYEALLALPGATVESVALEVGRDKSYLRSRLQLRTLAAPVQKAFLADQLQLGHALYLARLDAKEQVRILAHRLSGDMPLTVEGLQRWIEREVLCQLQGVPFALDDGTLVPAAGACTACPKRSSQAPDLFGTPGKQDRCLDPGCFQSKAAAWLVRAKAAIAAEAVQRGAKPGVKVLEVSRSYSSWELPKGTLLRGAWREVKPNDPKAQPAVVVDAKDHGLVLWVSTEPGPKGDGVDPSAARFQREETKRRAKAQAEAKRRRRIQEAVLAKLPSTLSAEDLRAVIAGYVEEMHHDTRKSLAALHGVEGKKNSGYGGWNYCAPIAAHIAKLGQGELVRFLLTLPLIAGTIYNTSGQARTADPLLAAAKRYKVDVKGIDQALAKEAGEKQQAKRAATPARKAKAAKGAKRVAK